MSTSNDKKSEVWDVYANTRMRFRVVWSEEISKEEAIKRFNLTDFEDIIDEEVLEDDAYDAD